MIQPVTSGEKVKDRSDAKEITILRFRLLKIRESYELLKLWLNSAQRGRALRRSLSALFWIIISWCSPGDATRATQTSIAQQQRFVLKGKILQVAWGSGKVLRSVQFQPILAIAERSEGSLNKVSAGAKLWPTWSAYLGFDEFDYTHYIYIITRHHDGALHCEMVSLTPGYIGLGLHIYCVSSIVHPNYFRLWVPLFWLTCVATHTLLLQIPVQSWLIPNCCNRVSQWIWKRVRVMAKQQQQNKPTKLRKPQYLSLKIHTSHTWSDQRDHLPGLQQWWALEHLTTEIKWTPVSLDDQRSGRPSGSLQNRWSLSTWLRGIWYRSIKKEWCREEEEQGFVPCLVQYQNRRHQVSLAHHRFKRKEIKWAFRHAIDLWNRLMPDLWILDVSMHSD